MSEAACEGLVLIVEDDHDVRQSLAEVLEDNEYRPIGAVNGRDALDRLRTDNEKPCVILLDIMMPVMDGWQFRAEQRDDPELGSIPVVVLSAHARASDAAERMGAAASLGKPVNLQALLDTVERFCR